MKEKNKNPKPRRKSHYDEYRAAVGMLDQDTKNRLELRRTLGMAAIVLFIIALFCVITLTGIGVDKERSVSGVIFADKETVLIECFGDSLTEGFTEGGILSASYPEVMKKKLSELFENDGNKYKCTTIDVKNYGQSGSILQDTSSSRLSGNADIVIIMYTANNFIEGISYEGTLESNIESVLRQGSQVFLMNYPVLKGSVYENKLSQANNYISSAASQYNIRLIDAASCFESAEDYDPNELFSSDGVHLTEKGYELLGNYAAQVIHDYYYELY